MLYTACRVLLTFATSTFASSAKRKCSLQSISAVFRCKFFTTFQFVFVLAIFFFTSCRRPFSAAEQGKSFDSENNRFLGVKKKRNRVFSRPARGKMYVSQNTEEIEDFRLCPTGHQGALRDRTRVCRIDCRKEQKVQAQKRDASVPFLLQSTI